MYKIIGGDGKEYGPISGDQLRQWISEGRINAQTQVLLEGTTDWKPLGTLAEFAASFPAAPAPAPAPVYQASTPDAARMVAGPAIGLIVVASVALALVLLNLVLTVSGANTFQMEKFGGQAPEIVKFMQGPGAIIGVVIGLVIYGLVLFGAIKMKKLESYGLAMTASILALLPCSACCLVGLPFGIWALVVLSKPEVKSAFH